jgi:hypothetical protein
MRSRNSTSRRRNRVSRQRLRLARLCTAWRARRDRKCPDKDYRLCEQIPDNKSGKGSGGTIQAKNLRRRYVACSQSHSTHGVCHEVRSLLTTQGPPAPACSSAIALGIIRCLSRKVRPAIGSSALTVRLDWLNRTGINTRRTTDDKKSAGKNPHRRKPRPQPNWGSKSLALGSDYRPYATCQYI